MEGSWDTASDARSRDRGLPAGVDRILVLGASRSGLAAAQALLALGQSVALTDHKSPADLPGLAQLEQRGARFLSEDQAEVEISHVQLLVKSPGVPSENRVVHAAREQGVVVWSEVELAYRLLPNPIHGVTGTNGKTTTTALLGHVFETAGRPTAVLGNIGTALASAIGVVGPDEELVVELSSFQLEDIDAFRPDTAIFLNLTQDHLDRHGSMEAYLASKANLFRNQRKGDVAVLNASDRAPREVAEELRARPRGPRVLLFSTERAAGSDAWLAEGVLHFPGGLLISVDEISLRGVHNMENCLAAGTAALARGVEAEALRDGLRTFPGVPHRLERAGTVRGVAYVNDSKATNVEATLKAIGAYPEGTHLILGGRDKGSDYRPVARACGGCRAVYVIGEATPLIERDFGAVRRDEQRTDIPLPESCGDLDAAVTRAAARARPGEVVLLAPACASFDQYENFEERGRHFMELVERLREAAGE